jgi:hypothetical protein
MSEFPIQNRHVWFIAVILEFNRSVLRRRTGMHVIPLRLGIYKAHSAYSLKSVVAGAHCHPEPVTLASVHGRLRLIKLLVPVYHPSEGTGNHWRQ